MALLKEFILNKHHEQNSLKEGLALIVEYLGEIGLETLDDIDRSVLYKGQCEAHDESHIERVVIIGTLLAAKENLTAADYGILLNALKYHDIGRINDAVDNEHGKRGAEKIRRMFLGYGNSGDLDLLCDAITLHSMHDAFLQAKRVSEPRLYKITSLLKDADNLDRVRLGDLNIEYLRSESAKQLVSFAEQVLEEFGKSLRA